MNPHRSRAAVGLALLALLVLGSCREGQQVLARVGSRVITVADFEAAEHAAQGSIPWPAPMAKHLLLENLIQRNLMLDEAAARGITRDTALAAVRRAAEQEQLLDAITAQAAPAQVPVSDAEVATFYDWHRTEHHVQMIYAPTRPLAQTALERIRAGEPFQQVAAAYNGFGIVPENGDLGWVPGGGTVEPIDGLIRSAPLGRLIGPIPAAGGWFLVRVLARRPATVPPLDHVRDQVRAQVEERKHRAIVQRLVENLKDQYHVELLPGGAQELFQQAAASGDTGAARHLPPEDLGLARYRDDHHGYVTYTLGEALVDLQSSSDRPDFSSVVSIERWIELSVVRRLLVVEARRRRLDQDPAVARRTQESAENAVLRSLYGAEVGANTEVSEDDLRAEYARRAGPGAPPYENLPSQLQDQLRSLALQTKRDSLLKAFTDDLRRKYPVTINEPLLERLPWNPPPPTLGPNQG